MNLVAAIHDVTPALADEVMALWHECRMLHLTPALFVVPDWHGWAPLVREAPFGRWLRQCADDGAEIFLHGMRHDEWESTRSLIDHVRAAGRTEDEAEFLGLSRGEAARRISEGAAALRACSLEPIGFVAPAWLAPRWLPALAAAHGLRLSEDAHGIRSFGPAGDVYVHAPAVRWSARSSLRAISSVGMALARRMLHAHTPIVRVALHPADLRHSATRDSLLRELMWWSANRAECSYRGAVLTRRHYIGAA